MMNKLQISRQCDGHDGNVRETCSTFRQEISRLIPTNDASLLDAIERLHIECKGCKGETDQEARATGMGIVFIQCSKSVRT